MIRSSTSASERDARAGRWADRALIACFAAALLAPAADTLWHFDPVPPTRDLRPLAVRMAVAAAWDERDPERLVAALRTWTGGQFGLRDSLLRLHARLTVQGLGVSSTEMVLVGRDGWLYLRGWQELESWRAVDPFEPEELEHLIRLLEERQRFFAERGIRYLVTVAPSKATIHPEHLPGEVTRVGAETRLDQLAAALSHGARVPFVDVRPGLRAAARRLPVFDPLETHWNAYGAFVAYREIGGALARWYPATRLLALSDVRLVRRAGRDPDLARMVGLAGVLTSPSVDVALRAPARAVERGDGRPFGDGRRGLARDAASRAPRASGPRLVLVHDSFGEALRRYFAESVPEALYLWAPSLALEAGDVRAIEAFAPDVVVQEVVERFLQGDPRDLRAFEEPAAD